MKNLFYIILFAPTLILTSCLTPRRTAIINSQETIPAPKTAVLGKATQENNGNTVTQEGDQAALLAQMLLSLLCQCPSTTPDVISHVICALAENGYEEILLKPQKNLPCCIMMLALTNYATCRTAQPEKIVAFLKGVHAKGNCAKKISEQRAGDDGFPVFYHVFSAYCNNQVATPKSIAHLASLLVRAGFKENLLKENPYKENLPKAIADYCKINALSWGILYFLNRPDISPELVATLLDELIRAGFKEVLLRKNKAGLTIIATCVASLCDPLKLRSPDNTPLTTNAKSIKTLDTLLDYETRLKAALKKLGLLDDIIKINATGKSQLSIAYTAILSPFATIFKMDLEKNPLPANPSLTILPRKQFEEFITPTECYIMDDQLVRIYDHTKSKKQPAPQN